MKTKIAIYGGTNLSHELVVFVSSLTKSLLKYPEVVIVSGGFDHYIKHPERKSVDRIVMETVTNFIDETELKQRFETWIPRENDRTKVERFREGKVVEVAGSTQARRFNIVQNVDAVITIKGEGNTRSVIELALAINKPVLPIAFSGGDSKKMWELYENDLMTTLKLPKELKIELQDLPTTLKGIEKLGKKVARFMKEAVKKTCLVLMPFEELHNNFYDNYIEKAIINSNYFAHRIDRTDKAGNIPALFHTSLGIAKSVIVDITGYNANVMYELGHVHAKNIKPLIILRNTVEKQSEINDLPFYLKQEMIVKENDTEEGYKKIKLAIENFLGLTKVQA